MKVKTIWFFFLAYSSLLLSQNLSVKTNHPVYDFLNQLRIKNILPYYDDVVLPLTRENVYTKLLQAKASESLLSEIDKKKLNLFLKYFPLKRITNRTFFDDPSSTFKDHFFSPNENYAYVYQDSAISFSIAPIVTEKNILLRDTNSKERFSSLITYGTSASLEYSDWFAAYFEVLNGFQSGDRTAAITDQRVKQSFSFNKTGLNYFDQTSGYITLKKSIFKVQLGRERVLWGVNRFDQMILNQTPQTFDFIKFDITYKNLSYRFLHGWLVQPTTTTYIDSLRYDVKNRNPKYIATSRFGYQPFSNLSFGLGQTIIYANRPLELAYLNPFLFWESAQRSLNDLDNSFLQFDSRYRPLIGVELNGTITLDDLNFEFLKKGMWNSAGNRLAWQMGFSLTNPFLPERLVVFADYVQIRPYTYSHPNGGEALTYTNNGFPLGLDLEPNTTMTSFKAIYDLTEKLSVSALFRTILHGENVLDDNGILIRNVGGSTFLSYRKYFFTDVPTVGLLDGQRVTTNLYELTLHFQYSYNLNFVFQSDYQTYSKFNKDEKTFSSSLQFNYNFY